MSWRKALDDWLPVLVCVAANVALMAAAYRAGYEHADRTIDRRGGMSVTRHQRALSNVEQMRSKYGMRR